MFRLPIILCALAIPVAPAQGAMAMVHPSVPEQHLTNERLRDMFLGRITTWQDGSAIVLVIVDDPGSDACLREITGRDRDRLIRGWRRLVFSGSGAMPLLAGSSTEALTMIAKNPGAVAVTVSATPDNRWRIIPLTPTLSP